jgi:hypothetical protein
MAHRVRLAKRPVRPAPRAARRGPALTDQTGMTLACRLRNRPTRRTLFAPNWPTSQQRNAPLRRRITRYPGSHWVGSQNCRKKQAMANRKSGSAASIEVATTRASGIASAGAMRARAALAASGVTPGWRM